MTNRTKRIIKFPSFKKYKVEVDFSGGSITSDAGVLLLSQVDQKLELTKNIARSFLDNRDQKKIKHLIQKMIQQRIYGIALGYEDLNDHNDLRKDIAFQTAVNSDKQLASSPTLCRFENTVNKQSILDIHKIMWNEFSNSFNSPPEELILDFDATDTTIYGNQEGKFFHGYYEDYCFLPLYVFSGSQLLVSYLRRSNEDQAKHAWAILSLLVKFLRQKWPTVTIIFRGDSGFCRHKMFDWCEKNNVDYITGLATNSRLKKKFFSTINIVKNKFKITNKKQREFTEFKYAAESWSKKRRVIGKAEYSEHGSNNRFIVTTLNDDPQDLYDKVYCARGNMENKIKEVQLELFGTRTSCHRWWSNQLRMMFTAIAYILIDNIKRNALYGTEYANLQAGTIRLKLFKIGAVVIRNTRRVKLHLSSCYPLKNVFKMVAYRLQPG